MRRIASADCSASLLRLKKCFNVLDLVNYFCVILTRVLVSHFQVFMDPFNEKLHLAEHLTLETILTFQNLFRGRNVDNFLARNRFAAGLPFTHCYVPFGPELAPSKNRG